MTRPHQNQNEREGLKGPGWAPWRGVTVRAVRVSPSLNSALLAAGRAAASKGELELRELLARPDSDGGEVPDRVIGSHISPFLL
jgi:hypothetical protein